MTPFVAYAVLGMPAMLLLVGAGTYWATIPYSHCEHCKRPSYRCECPHEGD